MPVDVRRSFFLSFLLSSSLLFFTYIYILDRLKVKDTLTLAIEQRTKSNDLFV